MIVEQNFSFWYSKTYHHKWATNRQIGMVGYVLRHGLLIFGCSMLVGLSLLRVLEGQIVGASGFSQAFPESILTSVIGGVIYGISMWFFSEWNYKKHSE